MDNTLFLIGGSHKGDAESVSTTLPLTDKPVFTPVPNLSYKGRSQCTAKLDQNTFVITGGSNYTPTLRDVTRYNVVDGTYETLSQLQQERTDHGCIVLKVNTKMWIIVTGGRYYENGWKYWIQHSTHGQTRGILMWREMHMGWQ